MNLSVPMQAEDKKLLASLQQDFPLTEQPYKTLGEALGHCGAEVIAGLKKWQSEGVLRRIGGILNPGELGYSTVLVAGAMEPAGLETAAALLGSLPQVTHNYLREGDFNLWFTLVYRDKAELKSLLNKIRKNAKPRHLLTLPALKYYKLRAVFAWDEEPIAPRKPGPGKARLKAETTQALLKLAGGSLPLVDRPFKVWGEELGLSEPQVISGLESLLSSGKLRRFGGILRHHLAGYAHNAMLALLVKEHQADRAGNALAQRPEISHCYLRRKSPLWPYNLYAMLHAQSAGELQRTLQKAVELAQPLDYKILKTLKEYKKISWVKED